TWVDVSEAMRELAAEQLVELGDRVTYVVGDAERLDELAVDPAQVLVSSRTLHHFSPASLQRVYRAAFDVVAPAGVVINLEHVGGVHPPDEALGRPGPGAGRAARALALDDPAGGAQPRGDAFAWPPHRAATLAATIALDVGAALGKAAGRGASRVYVLGFC